MSRHFQIRWSQARKLWRILRQPAYWPALRRGVAAAVEHGAVKYPDDFLTVVDVGANRGQFAVVAAHRFPEATLWCFEPLPVARAKLQTMLASRPNTTVIGTALSARSGCEYLHVTRQDDSSSLLQVGSRQQTEFPGTEEVGRMPVRTARLDELLSPDLITPPALLKIDVQGTELDVLEGAGDVVHAFGSIIVECSFVELYVGQILASQVIAFLASHGRYLHGVYNMTYGADGTCLQADLLFGV